MAGLLHLALHFGQQVRRLKNELMALSQAGAPLQGHCFPLFPAGMSAALRGHGRSMRAVMRLRKSSQQLGHLVRLPFAHPGNVALSLCLHDFRCHGILEVARNDELWIIILLYNTTRRKRNSHDASRRRLLTSLISKDSCT